MSAYECSPVTDGCGESFASLAGFDAHLDVTPEVRCDGKCSRERERHTRGKHVAKDGWTVCRPVAWLVANGYERNAFGDWFHSEKAAATRAAFAATPRAQTAVLTASEGGSAR